MKRCVCCTKAALPQLAKASRAASSTATAEEGAISSACSLPPQRASIARTAMSAHFVCTTSKRARAEPRDVGTGRCASRRASSAEQGANRATSTGLATKADQSASQQSAADRSSSSSSPSPSPPPSPSLSAGPQGDSQRFGGVLGERGAAQDACCRIFHTPSKVSITLKDRSAVLLHRSAGTSRANCRRA